MVFLKKYLSKQNFHPGAVNLFIHHLLRQIGTGLFGIFGPIYLYGIFNDIKTVFLFYIIGYGIYSLTLPWGMKIVNYFGFKKSMYYSLLSLVIYYMSIYLMGAASYLWLWFGITLVFWILTIYLYWVPYHTDFAKLTDKSNRGKNLAFLTGFIALTSIFTPVVSSVIISYAGYIWLFALIIFFIFLSSLYLKKIPSINEQFTYSLRKTYSELFSRKNFRLFIAYFSDGMQSSVGMIVWPLFIFLLLEGNFLSVGVLTSLVVLVTIAIRLLVGDWADRIAKKKIVRYTSVLHALGWVLKGLVVTPFHIFAAGSYHSFTTSATRISFDSLMYEKAADNGHYMDEYTVFRDMSLCMGRVVSLIIGLALLSVVSMQWLFGIAAFASLFLGII